MQLLIIFCFSVNAIAEPIKFTKEEKEFIASNPIIKVGMMPDFTPFAYYIKNTPVGFEHDLLKMISKRTGLEFEKKIANWTTIYSAFKDKKVDMITSISYKKYREPFTTFTSSYYDIPIMIFVRDNFGEYKGIKSLKGKKVGVLKDVFYIKELENMGTMNLVYYDNYADLTKDLVFGKIDALIQNLTNINYLIKKNLYSNLKLASELILPDTKKEDLRFGVQPEKPLLSSILQKALNSITKKEKEDLVNKWIGSIKEYKGGHIELNKDERAYLDTKVIKYCINPDGLPFEGLNEKGEHTGMSSDYYNLFEEMLSAKFELVKTKKLE
jgi:polar amino acid transport system substrate-binding protein